MYNSERYIERAVESVRLQNYTHWEMIVVDDCSTDKSLEIARNLAMKDRRVRLIKNPVNGGAAISRNIGIAAARGRYIAFLDADDQWLPRKLQIQVKFMLEKGVEFSYTDYSIIDEEGEIIKLRLNPPPFVTYKGSLKTNFIGCLTAMYDAQVLGKIYMPEVRKRQDYGLWLRVLKVVDRGHCASFDPLAIYTSRSKSISSNKFSLVKHTWKIYRDTQNLSFFSSLYYVTLYTFHKIERDWRLLVRMFGTWICKKVRFIIANIPHGKN